MKSVNFAKSDTDSLMVFTSTNDGHMYLRLANDDEMYDLRLTEENRDALRKVLGPTETWAGILGEKV